MINLNERNMDTLDSITNRNPLTFPMAAYIEYAAAKKKLIDPALVREIDEAYFGRFDSEQDFIKAVQGDYGIHLYPTNEKIYKDFLAINSRYYKVS